VPMAEEKGRADGEEALSKIMHEAAYAGDTKAALEILKHVHGWVAKQAVQVEVNQSISILGALKEAEERAMNVIDVTPIASTPSETLKPRLAPHKQTVNN